MLVLTRKLNQRIHIGNQITVNIVRIRGNTVQLGIEAPKDIHILRSELLDKQNTEKQNTEIRSPNKGQKTEATQTVEPCEPAVASEVVADDEAEHDSICLQLSKHDAGCNSRVTSALTPPLQPFILSLY